LTYSIKRTRKIHDSNITTYTNCLILLRFKIRIVWRKIRWSAFLSHFILLLFFSFSSHSTFSTLPVGQLSMDNKLVFFNFYCVHISIYFFTSFNFVLFYFNKNLYKHVDAFDNNKTDDDDDFSLFSIITSFVWVYFLLQRYKNSIRGHSTFTVLRDAILLILQKHDG